jgi:hypothetical protein
LTACTINILKREKGKGKREKASIRTLEKLVNK